jgi:outer membrane protein assembly factor BamB
LSTHQSLWSQPSPCADWSGGGTPAYASGRLYARSFYGDAHVFDAVTGAALYPMTTRFAPAVTNTLIYAVVTGDLVATAPGATTATWRFAGHNIETAPIVVGSSVLIAGRNQLWALDGTTGAVLGNTTLPGNVLVPDEWNYSSQVSGLAAADGRIFVPTEAGLIAY